MDKPNKKALAERRQKAFEYRWGFCRRNKKYKDSYDQLNKSSSKDLYNRIVQEFEFLPTDYNKSYKDLIREARKNSKIMNAPSSTGKTYIPMQVDLLFPEEDVKEKMYNCCPGRTLNLFQ